MARRQLVINPYACDCPSCRAQLARRFEQIAAHVFTDEETTAIAERAARDYSPPVLRAFLKGTDDDT